MTRDDCEHGQLRRSCEVCELRAELNGMNREVEEQSRLIEKQAGELAELRESIHHANGVADLAMKHRDAAEKELDTLRHRIKSAPVGILREQGGSLAEYAIIGALTATVGKRVRLVVEDGEFLRSSTPVAE